ncbi:MAG: hypothetical protein KQA33_00785, partial [Candidatus Aenigmarchaeota archaeon]|nr:hypothetical protein [Candidatus Aenigmarchaeota archaeon]
MKFPNMHILLLFSLLAFLVQLQIGAYAVPCNITNADSIDGNNFFFTTSKTITTNVTDCSIEDDGDGVIIVNASDIVLNCGGNWTLYGTGTGIGINITGQNNVTFLNCRIADYETAAMIDASNNTNITNMTANSSVLLYSINDINSTVHYLKTFTKSLNVSFSSASVNISDYTGSVTIPNTSSNMTGFVFLNNNSADSWIHLNMSYNSSKVGLARNASTIKLFNSSDGTSWSNVSDTGVNTSGAYAYGNISSFPNIVSAFI